MSATSNPEAVHLASFLDQLTDSELMNLVKQEAFGAVPEDIAAALRANPDVWYRVIVSIITDINDQLSRKKTKFFAGNMSSSDVAAYNAWRAKAISVKSRLDIRVIEARALRKQANIEQSKRVGLAKFYALHSAVSAHRQAMNSEEYEATEHDMALWKVLSDIEAGVYDHADED